MVLGLINALAIGGVLTAPLPPAVLAGEFGATIVFAIIADEATGVLYCHLRTT